MDDTVTKLGALMRLEQRRKTTPAGYPRFPDLPGGRYTDPGFFELEQGLFRRTWLLAGHLDDVPEPRCFKTWDMAGEPILLVHARSGAINAFYNTCLHRGAPVAEGRGKRPLVCGYHGWAYNDEGQLISVRHKEDFVDLDISCRALKQIRCETIGKMIFVNFDQDAPPLEEWLSAVSADGTDLRL